MSEEEPPASIHKDPLVRFSHRIIVYCVKALSIMMILAILASVIDVGFVLYDKIIVTKPMGVLHTEGILTVLGAFIAVLIAIEIFNNIIVYLQEDHIHIKLVLSTALIAISRKVIILDYNNVAPTYLFGIGAVVLATAISYWLVAFKNSK